MIVTVAMKLVLISMSYSALPTSTSARTRWKKQSDVFATYLHTRKQPVTPELRIRRSGITFAEQINEFGRSAAHERRTCSSKPDLSRTRYERLNWGVSDSDVRNKVAGKCDLAGKWTTCLTTQAFVLLFSHQHWL
jgi:hypothetical protein